VNSNLLNHHAADIAKDWLEMENTLAGFVMSDFNRERLEQVDREQLMKIIIHISEVARECLGKIGGINAREQ